MGMKGLILRGRPLAAPTRARAGGPPQLRTVGLPDGRDLVRRLNAIRDF